MKNYFILILVVWSAGFVTSCSDKLELEYDGRSSLDELFRTKNGVRGYLNACYGYRIMPEIERSVLTDEAHSSERVYQGSLPSLWYVDAYSAANYSNVDGQPWTGIYQSIRKCNVFLKRMEGVSANDLASLEDEVTSWKAQAYTLRALYYLQLIKRYGSVPLITEPYEIAHDFSQDVRVSVSAVVNQILADCDAAMAAPQLPLGFSWTIRTGENYIMNRAVVQAIRSQAILYAASPLYGSDSYSWQDAASITGNALSSLLSNGYELWTETPGAGVAQNAYALYFITPHDEQRARDKETIYGGVRVNVWGGNGMPSTPGQSSAGACPTQELVDSYEMQATGLLPVTGYSDPQHLQPVINTASGYDPQNPYEGRDPRFYATIYFNGAPRNLESPTANLCDSYVGGKDGISSTDRRNTHTGYYLRKYNNWRSGRDNNADGEIRMFRLAELYLNFAEAAYQATGNPDQAMDIGNGMSLSARDAVNTIRRRAGMPDLPAGLSKGDFEIRYRNERRVELAYEGHRYFDVRRWKIMGESEHYVTGMRITENGGDYTYERISFERESYKEKLYLYPIPQAEINKMQSHTGTSWQNPGWN